VLLGAVYYGRYLFTKVAVDEPLPTLDSPIPSPIEPGLDQPSSEVGSTPQASVTNPPALTPKIVKRGTFGDVDFVHKGSGEALLLAMDEKQFIRFENFRVTNGPDLYVYLTKNPQPSNLASLGEFISLGQLKGTVGNQNYELTNLPDGYNTVVIWCRQFSALFSFAVLR